MKYCKSPWLLFFILMICSLLAVGYVQQRYTGLLQGGVEYQWPVKIDRTINWVPSDDLTVSYLGTRTTWAGKQLPVIGRPVYVQLGVQPNGILYIKNATDVRPTEGLYILADAKSFYQGILDFTIPFNRVRMKVENVNPAFYSGQYKGILLATLKLKNGEAVITGIYVKGVPLTEAKPDAADEGKDGEAIWIPGGSMDEKNASALGAANNPTSTGVTNGQPSLSGPTNMPVTSGAKAR